MNLSTKIQYASYFDAYRVSGLLYLSLSVYRIFVAIVITFLESPIWHFKL